VVASEVRVQPDMKHARVFISVKGTNKEQADAIKALDHAAGFIRRELVERLQLRRRAGTAFYAGPSQEHVGAHRAAIEGNEEGQPAHTTAVAGGTRLNAQAGDLHGFSDKMGSHSVVVQPRTRRNRLGVVGARSFGPQFWTLY